MSDPSSPQDHWARFWSSGYLTSLPDQYPIGYTGSVRHLWESVFAGMPERVRLLDVGTGGGGVALLASECFRTHGIRGEIHGIDRVDIEPPRVFARSRLMHFHPSTPAESTGFQSLYFDLVTSQFAIEYTDIPLSMAEMSRILKNNAEAVFLLHSEDSAIVDIARSELCADDLLWGERGLFDSVRRFLQAIDSGDRALLVKAQSRVSRAFVEIRSSEYFQDYPDLLETSLGSARQALEIDEDDDESVVLSSLEAKEAEAKDRRGRLGDLVNASLDERGLRRMISVAKSAGMSILIKERFHHESGEILGWLLRLRKTT